MVPITEKLVLVEDLSVKDVKYWFHLSGPRDITFGEVTKYILDERGVVYSITQRGYLPHTSGQLYVRMPSGNVVGIYLGRPEDSISMIAPWDDGRDEGIFLGSLVRKDFLANYLAYVNYCKPNRVIKDVTEMVGSTIGARVRKPEYTFKDAISLKNFPYDVVEINLPLDSRVGLPLGSAKVVIATRENLGIKNVGEFQDFARRIKPRIIPFYRYGELAVLYLDEFLGKGNYNSISDKLGRTSYLSRGIHSPPEESPDREVVITAVQTDETLRENNMVPLEEWLFSKPVIITPNAKNPLLREFLGDLIIG